MNLIIFHKGSPPCGSQSKSLPVSSSPAGPDGLRFVLGDQVISSVIFNGLSKSFSRSSGRFAKRHSDGITPGRVIFAMPQEWQIEPVSLKPDKAVISAGSSHLCCNSTGDIMPYIQNVPVDLNLLHSNQPGTGALQWLIISNGRFATRISPWLLGKILLKIDAEVISVNARPDLMNNAEKIRLTSGSKIAGFRRLYSDSAELTPIPSDWPCHLFIKLNILDKLLNNYGSFAVPESFDKFLEKCRSNTIAIQAINIGGAVFDLERDNGLLGFCRLCLDNISPAFCRTAFAVQDTDAIDKNTKFIGKVLLGDNVRIEPEVVVAGPTIIGNNVKLERGAVINSSIIGSRLCVPENTFMNNSIIRGTQIEHNPSICRKTAVPLQSFYSNGNLSMPEGSDTAYRYWPRFSYARSLKRIADCIAAVIVIILFAPLVPFIALTIKLASPGPVFFKDLRQGLHGKKFNCLKFRTMITGADRIQEKLRFVSHVDGPQFKIVDDPRINSVGKFLRDTYIDEIPQFLNVLAGQMSVIGPRPSPESENTMCPFWRDARLSVKPGITGLWQVSRTRQSMKDFQEWILYDTEYVRNLSLKMDLWICWTTFKHLVNQFINQF